MDKRMRHPPMQGNQRTATATAKFKQFTDSNATWGAVGVLIGATGAALSQRWLFVLGSLFLLVAILKVNFFEGRKWLVQIIGNGLLCLIVGLVLVETWRILPKPKQPPTVQEIADAIVAKQSGAKSSQSTLPPSAASEIAAQVIKKLPVLPPPEVGKINLTQLPDEELESMAQDAGKRLQHETASYSENWQFSRRSYDQLIRSLKDQERYKAMERQLEIESGIRERLERETKKILPLANPVREEIVRRLTRRNEQTDEDGKLGVIFDAALTGKIDANSVGQMSMYLQKLPGRLSAARSR